MRRSRWGWQGRPVAPAIVISIFVALAVCLGGKAAQEPLTGFHRNSLRASSQALPAQEDNSSVAAPVTRADVPLNLIETPDGFLISTNSPYGSQYLLAYDETRHAISDQVTLPSLWYGLAYEPHQQLLLASDGNHSVYALSFKQGRFGEPRTMA